MADAWYYACTEQSEGPISIADLRILAARGKLKPTDLVWTPGMSQWAPASMTRGLFPPPPKAALPSPVSMPPSSPTPLGPESRQRRREDDILRVSRTSRTKPRPGSQSSGSKALIAFGVVFAIVVCIAGAVFILEVATAPNRRGRSVNFFLPPPQEQPPPPPVFKGGINPGGLGAIPANGSYEIDLNLKDQEHTQVLHFNRNELVHITVTTTDWGLGEEPDVDLYVYGPNGVLVDFDDLPFKDCDVSFLAVLDGDYRVVVRLDSGNQAHCTVRY